MFRLQSPVRTVAEVISAKQQSLGQDRLPILLKCGINVGLTLRGFLNYPNDTVGFSLVEAKACSIAM